MNSKKSSGSEYEAFIEELVKGIKDEANKNEVIKIEKIGFGRKNKLEGKSGINHQIDVSFVDNSNLVPKLIILECKNFNSRNKIQLGHVKILKATIDDIAASGNNPGNVQGILISTSCVQSGAAIYAEYYKISLQIVSDGPNWNFQYGKILQFGLAMEAESAKVCGIAIHSRKCINCNQMFPPQGNEKTCEGCKTHC